MAILISKIPNEILSRILHYASMHEHDLSCEGTYCELEHDARVLIDCAFVHRELTQVAHQLLIEHISFAPQPSHILPVSHLASRYKSLDRCLKKNPTAIHHVRVAELTWNSKTIMEQFHAVFSQLAKSNTLQSLILKLDWSTDRSLVLMKYLSSPNVTFSAIDSLKLYGPKAIAMPRKIFEAILSRRSLETLEVNCRFEAQDVSSSDVLSKPINEASKLKTLIYYNNSSPVSSTMLTQMLRIAPTISFLEISVPDVISLDGEIDVQAIRHMISPLETTLEHLVIDSFGESTDGSHHALSTSGFIRNAELNLSQFINLKSVHLWSGLLWTSVDSQPDATGTVRRPQLRRLLLPANMERLHLRIGPEDIGLMSSKHLACDGRETSTEFLARWTRHVIDMWNGINGISWIVGLIQQHKWGDYRKLESIIFDEYNEFHRNAEYHTVVSFEMNHYCPWLEKSKISVNLRLVVDVKHEATAWKMLRHVRMALDRISSVRRE